MKLGERVYVQCACREPSHLMEIELGGTIAEPKLIVWNKLNWHLPFLSRVMSAVQYVFKHKSGWCDFEEFHIDANGAEQIHAACALFLSSWKKRVSKDTAQKQLIHVIESMQNNSKVAAEWAELVAEKTGRSIKEIEETGLTAYDFPNSTVSLYFMDESSITFNNAFHVLPHEGNVIAVFTEHCGYHTFQSSAVAQIQVREVS